MKKILTIITTAIVSFALIGCATFKSWFQTIDWNNVNTVIIPVVQQTAKTTTYLVCEKNKDLKPIFIAVGNGLLLAVANEAFTPDQFKEYIKQGLGNDADKYYAIVIASMDSIITGYTTFYNTNWKSVDDANEQVSIEAVFSKYISAVATGIIDGAKLSAEQFKVVSANNVVKFCDVNKLKVIK